MNFDYQVVFLPDMPVNECVTENEDGSYTIFINEKLGQEKKYKAYEHAILHIKNDDFAKCDVQGIEANAHKTEEDSKWKTKSIANIAES